MPDHDGSGGAVPSYSNLPYIFGWEVCTPMIRSSIVHCSVPQLLYNCMPNAAEIKQYVGRDDALV